MTFRFEKWQALGNDYLIFEERALPFELTPARIERICDVHTGVGSDGVLLLGAPDSPASEPSGLKIRSRATKPGSSGAPSSRTPSDPTPV